MVSVASAEPSAVNGTSLSAPPVARVSVFSGRPNQQERYTALLSDQGFAAEEGVIGDPDEMAANALANDLVLFCCSGARPELLQFLAALRGERPCLVLSERVDVLEQVVALEFGADDLVAADADPRLVAAKIRALLRARRLMGGYAGKGEWGFDPHSRIVVTPRGRRIVLSPNEADLLSLFADQRERTVAHHELRLHLGHRNANTRVLLSRLRRKLTMFGDPSPFRSVRGAGHIFQEPLAHRSLRDVRERI